MARAQEPVLIQGKVVGADNAPVGAFTIRAYATGTSTEKPLAQTLTLANGSYSLPVSGSLKEVVLRSSKLSYFSIPPYQTIQLTLPKTEVPDIAAVHNYGQAVPVQDLLAAFSIRQKSVYTLTNYLTPSIREQTRKKIMAFDLESLPKSSVSPDTLMAIKEKFGLARDFENPR
jgi:hypothetical protein